MLQFINAMNLHLLDPLLHFSPYFVFNRIQICDVGWQKVWWNECRCLFPVSRARWAATLPCWKIKNSPRISNMTGSIGTIAFQSENLTVVCTTNLHFGIDKDQVHSPQLGHTYSHHYCCKQIFFMKLFQTSNIDIVKCCQSHFCFDLPSVVHGRRTRRFDIKYRDHSNRFCQMISHLWMLVCSSPVSLFRYCWFRCRSFLVFS